jgi:hypothetical protein
MPSGKYRAWRRCCTWLAALQKCPVAGEPTQRTVSAGFPVAKIGTMNVRHEGGQTMMRLLLVLLLAVVPTVNAALTVDGYRAMLAKHGKDNEAIDLQVRMYLDGLLDGLVMASSNLPDDQRTWCIPDSQPLTDELAYDLFQKELTLRGDEYAEFSELGIDVPFSLVMVDALERRFPCRH